MRAVARTLRLQRDTSARQFEIAVRTILGFSGAFLCIAGMAIAFCGLRSDSDGWLFYGVTGFGLTISGALIANRIRAGAWSYLAVFAVTVTWSLRNIDQGPSLEQRLLGPILLLAILAVLMPALSKWQPRQAVIAFCILVFGTVALGLSSTGHGPLSNAAAVVTHFLDTQAKGLLQ